MLVGTHKRMLPGPEDQTTRRPLGSRTLRMIFLRAAKNHLDRWGPVSMLVGTH